MVILGDQLTFLLDHFHMDSVYERLNKLSLGLRVSILDSSPQLLEQRRRNCTP
jgi:hypothetical protein